MHHRNHLHFIAFAYSGRLYFHGYGCKNEHEYELPSAAYQRCTSPLLRCASSGVHGKAIHRKRHVGRRKFLFSTELHNAYVIGRQNEIVSPEIMHQRRDVASETGQIRVSNPGEDMLPVVVRSLIKGAECDETFSQPSCRSTRAWQNSQDVLPNLLLWQLACFLRVRRSDR
jgi:hypothetical protein